MTDAACWLQVEHEVRILIRQSHCLFLQHLLSTLFQTWGVQLEVGACVVTL